MPVGVPGELCIGGDGLARGYLSRAGADRRDASSPTRSRTAAARVYRTGDLVRAGAPTATLEFLGRVDHQVKVRGFRIELGEIEAVLRPHPACGNAWSSAREDAPGDQRLVAYVVPRGRRRVRRRRCARHLRAQLPEYMVPTAVRRAATRCR